MAFFVSLKINTMKKLFFAVMIVLSTATVVQAQTKIAYVNYQMLIDTLPSHKKAVIEIQNLSAQAARELNEMESNIKKENNAYLSRKSEQTGIMNASDEDRLTKMQNELQYREQEINAILQKMAQELNGEIMNTVTEAIEIIKKRKHLDSILDRSSMPSSGGTDVTNEVIPELLKIDAAKTSAKKAVVGQ